MMPDCTLLWRPVELFNNATWQRITGYNFRSYVELAMQRYKRIFGNTMKAGVVE